jgi:hypothetical protein
MNSLKRLKAIFTKPRVMHYADIFIAATGTALWWNRYQLLNAHGLNIVGSIAFGASVAGGKAVVEAFRKDFTPPPIDPPPAP